jgi:3-oxoacyl-(acyl-carrier-protein) synthase
MPSPHIFVTGLGAVTPLGFSVAGTWSALLAGRDAVGPFDLFDLGGLACNRAGQIRGYSPPPAILEAGAHDRALGFAAGACLEALGKSGMRNAECGVRSAECGTWSAECGIVTATNFGSLDRGECALVPAAGEPPSSLPPDTCRDRMAGAGADLLARALCLGGPRATVTLSCAAGAAGLALAAGILRRGRAERMLVVGYDALSRFAWSGLCALRTMARDWVRPFDRNRSGTIFSEGAAALLLETGSACRRRGAAPLAELAGWGANNNGYHMTAPAPRGAGSAQVMRQALARAGLPPEAIDHFNAHGTGTRPNDLTESQALADVFGAHAAAIPVTSVKGSLGHMLGAAGTVEAVASVLTLRDGVIPPTTHFETPDPECPVDLVANAPREVQARCVLSNSAGIGGCNAAVIFRRCDG